MQTTEAARQEHSTVEKPQQAASTAFRERPQIGWWAVVAVIALFVFIGHIRAVWTGLYLDDYAHYQHLIDGDWSYRSAVDSARLGIVGEVLDLWGRQEAGLRFYRPVAFWIMRTEYTAVAWSPAGMHVFSLLWHFGCSMLTAVIATRCLGRRFWGLVAGGLMAIHPAHVGTVYWIACQTELLTTFFLLCGLLAYARYAGWPEPWFLAKTDRQDAARLSSPKSGPTPETGDAGLGVTEDAPAGARGGHVRFALIALLCYGLALGCRENATFFPLICWLGDRLIGARRRGRLRWDHLAFVAVFGIYMLLRYEALGGFPVPPPPYLHPVSASAAFVQYIAYKIVTYTLGLFCCLPIVPIGSRSFFAQQPAVFYGLFAGVVVLWLIVWWAFGRRRALLWPAVWLGALFAPVMLVFASPHHLYLPSLGMVLVATTGLAALAGAARHTPVRWPRLRGAVSSTAMLVLALVLHGLTWCMGFSYVRGVLSEDIVVRDVLRQHRPLRDGDHLFFINLPVLAYYCVPAIEQQLNIRGLHGHVLVFAPDLICMDAPSTVDVLDRHRIRVTAPADRRYLSGVTGTMLLGVMGIGDRVEEGQIFDAGLFTVTVEHMDTRGVRSLLYEFDRPIDSPEYHFYLGSPQFMAWEMEFAMDRLKTEN